MDILPVKNSLQNRNTYTRIYTLGLDSSINLPWDFIFKTDANYRFRNGTGISGDDENEILWNMKLSWKFLKEKQAELSVYWADILSQRKIYHEVPLLPDSTNIMNGN